MEKDAYYFPHFSNARIDRKILRVRKELGLEGYGIFFMLLEVLRDQDGYKYPVADIDLLADDFGTSEQKVRAVIANYQLFSVDEVEMFFSLKFNEFMQPYLDMKEQRRQAGIASGKARHQKQIEHRTAVERVLNENEQRKGKESKEKESKEPKPARQKYGSIVLLTPTDYDTLCATYGLDAVGDKIRAMNLYCEANGKTYKSYAAAIRSWFKRDGVDAGDVAHLQAYLDKGYSLAEAKQLYSEGTKP